jgi:hypothetical protein
MRDASERPVADRPAPDAENRRRLHLWSTRAARLARLHGLLVLARRVLLATVVLAALLAERESWLPKLLIVGVPAAALGRAIHRRHRVRRQRSRAARAAAFCAWRLACLGGRWPGTGAPGTRYRDDGHPYALDLDLFAAGGLFELLNTACTRSGEDTLADWLLAPAPADVVRDRRGRRGRTARPPRPTSKPSDMVTFRLPRKGAGRNTEASASE